MQSEAPCGNLPAGILIPATVRYLLWGIVALSVIFAAAIFVIPLPLYRLTGHCLEAAVAITCMFLCLYAYRHWSRRVILLLAAFAFGEYALATTFWYLYSQLPVTETLGRPLVFTTVAEFSFLGFLILFIAAFQVEAPANDFPARYSWILLVVFITIPALIATSTGINIRTALLFLRFLIVEQLLVIGLRHGFSRYRLLWAGICLRCLASGLYGLRETILIANPSWQFSSFPSLNPMSLYDLSSIVGPLMMVSFAIIALGLLEYIVKRDPSGAPTPQAC